MVAPHDFVRGGEDVTIQPVVRVAAHELVVDQLRKAIHLGTFAPGDKLPPERELARRLGVSRETVREAIRVLETQGYVESRRGATGGLVVLDQRKTREDLKRRLRDEWDNFENILDFRLANECAAARLAATRRDDDDLARLQSSFEEIRRGESLAQSRRADSAFHLAIADAAGNPLLRDAVEKGRTAMFLPADALSFEVIFGNSVEGHHRILSALVAADPHAAEKAMSDHIQTTRRELHEILSS